MNKIFEAAFYVGDRYKTLEDVCQKCIDVVEAAGSGRVTLFLDEPNQPGRLPERVQRSLAMWRFENGQWQAISIHTGTACSLGEEKPHL